jgi:hypothetical protein
MRYIGGQGARGRQRFKRNFGANRMLASWPAEEKDMNKTIIFVSAAMIGVFLVVGPAKTQVAPQTV